MLHFPRHVAFYSLPAHSTVVWEKHDTPIGPLMLGMVDDFVAYLSCITWPLEEHLARWQHISPFLRIVHQNHAGAEVIAKLFSPAPWPDVKVAVNGTPFQRQVWQELPHIPVSETVTYGQLAARLNKPLAARAVGSAVGANRVGILIPCHRVLASNGKLGGFGWGPVWKEKLLAAEAKPAPPQRYAA